MKISTRDVYRIPEGQDDVLGWCQQQTRPKYNNPGPEL